MWLLFICRYVVSFTSEVHTSSFHFPLQCQNISTARRATHRITLKKISGTKMVPLGHRLIIRKTVPFGALPFQKNEGTGFQEKIGNSTLLQSGTILVPLLFVEKLCPRGTRLVPFLLKGHHSGKNGATRSPFWKMVPFCQGHYFVLVPLFVKMVLQAHCFSTFFLWVLYTLSSKYTPLGKRVMISKSFTTVFH